MNNIFYICVKRKNMDLNLLKGEINTNNKTDLSLKQFWALYLKLLYSYDILLSDKEVSLLSHILSSDKPDSNWFKKPLNKELQKQHDKMSMPEISRIKKKLIGMEILQKDGVISESLINMAKNINDKKNINLHFYINMV